MLFEIDAVLLLAAGWAMPSVGAQDCQAGRVHRNDPTRQETSEMTAPDQKRRQLLQVSAPASPTGPGASRPPSSRAAARLQMLDGVQSGDVTDDRALIWSRCDRPGRLIVEWDTRSRFGNPRRMVSSVTDAGQDFTARVDLRGLPADQSIFYRARFEDARSGVLSEPWLATCAAPRSARADIRFVWGGDTCGQGCISGLRRHAHLRKHASAATDFSCTVA